MLHMHTARGGAVRSRPRSPTWGVLHAVVEGDHVLLVLDRDVGAQLLGGGDEVVLCGWRRRIVHRQRGILGVGSKHVLNERRFPCTHAKRGQDWGVGVAA